MVKGREGGGRGREQFQLHELPVNGSETTYGFEDHIENCCTAQVRATVYSSEDHKGENQEQTGICNSG